MSRPRQDAGRQRGPRRPVRISVVVALLASCAEERPRPETNVTGRIHPPGILNEDSEAFHGRELARRNYDFALCASCHGEDFRGGRSNASCMDCHDDEPTACATCHRDDTESAPHRRHRETGVECAECHVVPARWEEDGHILRSGVRDEAPAELVFGARAAATPLPALRAGAPEYLDGTCSNVYCHGDVLAAGGVRTRPQWNDPITGACDRCHGAPPPSHARDECASCHAPDAPHVDTIVQVVRACDGCHGSAGNPAPPRDLAGNMFTTAIGVGAHRAHLDGSSRLRAPIECSACHAVPASVTTPGHIDSADPAEVAVALGWNRSTETCATAWCHGDARPRWTEQGGAACGTCHGAPPSSPAHAGITSVAQCASCHPGVIDSVGNMLFANGASEHMDGDVDVQ